MLTKRHTWFLHPIAKDYFWDKASKDPIEVGSLFEYMSLDSSMSGASQTFQILFADHNDCEGTIVPPRSVLKMRVEKEEVFFLHESQTNRPAFRKVGWDYSCTTWDEEAVQHWES